MLDNLATLIEHPDVNIIWNIWPISLGVWTIIRVPLNIFFFWLYIPFGWIFWLWNFVMETTTYWYGQTPIVTLGFIFNCMFTLTGVLVLPIPLILLSWIAWTFFGILNTPNYYTLPSSLFYTAIFVGIPVGIAAATGAFDTAVSTATSTSS